MKRDGVGVRYAYVLIFVALAAFYGVVLASIIGFAFDSRKSVAAFFVVPLSLVLVGIAAFGTQLEGRVSLIAATAAFGFVPGLATAAFTRIRTPIVWPAKPEPGDPIVPFLVSIAFLFAFIGAAPFAPKLARGIDRFARVLAPLLVLVEIAMFVVAMAHARRPDPDTFMATLPEPSPLAVGQRMTIAKKTLHYASKPTHRDACQVVDETETPYTDAHGCSPAVVTTDEATGMIMVRRYSAWSSSKALRPRQIAKRLAAPVGWTHLAGGGALLASIALVLATAFAHRAGELVAPPEIAPGGYRLPAPAPVDASAHLVLRDRLEARARGARAVALTVAASSALPLAAALAHGLGR